MKRMLILLSCVAVLGMGTVSLADENETLGDVMFLLADQVVGLGTFANGTLTVGDEKKDASAFSRAGHRCTGAQYLLNLIDSRKGSVDANGNLAKGELTPSKFETMQGTELDNNLKGFSMGLAKVSRLFEEIKIELQAQAAKPAAERKNTQLRVKMASLDSAIKESHKAFKPQP